MDAHIRAFHRGIGAYVSCYCLTFGIKFHPCRTTTPTTLTTKGTSSAVFILTLMTMNRREKAKQRQVGRDIEVWCFERKVALLKHQD